MTGRARAIVVAVSLALALGGACGGGDKGAATTSTSRLSQAEGSAPTATTNDVDEPVTMCPFLSKADAEAILGAPLAQGPTEQPASSAQLGGCEYYTATGMGLVTGARPVEEYEGTATAAENPEPIADLGQDAVWGANQGLIVKLKDQRWFLTVQAFRDTNMDKDLAVQAARKVVPAAAG